MADDSGQRLLDVIDDPSALDEFLGTLTSDVVPDNVVESLARSLAAEFDSPNEGLFESSSDNLTDISHSAVPFDFDPDPTPSHHIQNPFTTNTSPNNDFHQSEYSSPTPNYSCDQEEVEVETREQVRDTPLTHSKEGVKSESGHPHPSSDSSSLSTPVLIQKTTSSTISTHPHPPQPTTTTLTPTTNTTTNGPTHVYVTTPEQAQYASLGQLVQAQQNAAVLAGMNQQLQALNAQPGPSLFIDPTTGQPMMVAGGNSFGTTNLLVAGVQPHATYTVLPNPTSLFSTNTITMQPQIQAIKTTHGTGGGFIQAASTQSNPTTLSLTTPTTKHKNPPHLLPKPNNGSTTPNSSDHGHGDMGASGGNQSINPPGGGGGNNVVVTSSAGSITMTTESLTQILQHQQATVTNSTGMSLSQPSFAIGAGGQVVQVSGMQTLNSISGSQIFMNQFGQQMLVPTGMSPGVQFIVRQQPQAQVLTIQAPTPTTQATTANGKVVRFVSAPPQVPQVTQNSIQLQQIQTPQGTTWVAVRSTPLQQHHQHHQHQHPVVSIQPPTSSSPAPVVVQAKSPTPPPPPQPPPTPPVVTVTTDTISACIQSVIERLQSPSPPLTTTVQSKQYSNPISTPLVGGDKSSSFLDSTDSTPPPKKKPKYSKKKKVTVTLDLEQLLKQSGIMDEDLEDDGTGFSFGDFFSSTTTTTTGGENEGNQSEESIQQNGIHNNNNNNNNNNQKDFSKSNGTTPLVPFTPTVPTHSHILKPSTKSKQRKAVVKVDLNQNSPVLVPPSPQTPKPPPKKSKKKPTDAGVQKNSPCPLTPVTPLTPKETPKKKKVKKSLPGGGVDVKVEVMTNSNFIRTTPTTTPKKPPPKGKKRAGVKVKVEEGNDDMSTKSPTLPPTTPTQQQQQQQQPTPQRRIVQTIQLTPQNQTLLRNIQAQIQKLLSLTSRNEVEENALQKLINLQSEVIKTGTPVPNPPHLQTLNSVNGGKSGSERTDGSPTTLQPLQLRNGDIGGGSLEGGGGMKVLRNGLTNTPIKSPNSTSTNQPPPLVLNKSCTNGKYLVSRTTPNNSRETTLHHQTQTGTGEKNIIPSGEGTLTQGQGQGEEEDESRIPRTVEEFNTTGRGGGGGGGEMTSSGGSIIPTTTLSMSMSSLHEKKEGQGLPNGHHHYYNSSSSSSSSSSFDSPLSAIDEKKLEEQLMARLEQEEETRIQWRKDEFEKRLRKDRDSFVCPDYLTKFHSLEDATERLMHFHVGRDTAEITFEEFDEDFAETSSQLLNKFTNMVSKYRALLLKESMRDVECAERVMLERLFVAEEKLKLECDRGLVQQGELLDLPPAPPSWVGRIRQMVDSEVKEMERDSLANQQVQSAIDSIISFEPNGTHTSLNQDKEKIEYDAFGVPISTGNYNNLNSSSADIDEAVRSILL